MPLDVTGIVMKITFIVILCILSGCAASTTDVSPPTSGQPSPGISQSDVRALLLAGNKRFVDGATESHSWQQEKVVKTGTYGQIPSIGVLGCADSRIPVEIVFDVGVGDLFVNRVAGGFETKESSATFEYGVEALGVHTILVLGHTKCGAVAATLSDKDLPGNMNLLVKAIRPGLAHLEKGAPEQSPEALLDAAVEANTRFQMKQVLDTSDLLRAAHAQGRLQVFGAIYDVDTGKVRLLD